MFTVPVLDSLSFATLIEIPMPLSLEDPRWNNLNGSYGGTGDVVTWLTQAYANGLNEERLGDLINEVQHQGDMTTAMYALAPHLVHLAGRLSGKLKISALSHAGMIYADSGAATTVACPDFLKEDFNSHALIGANALSPLLVLTCDFDEFKWAVASLAGFMGHHSFGRLLSGLDLHKGRYYLACLDEPLPEEK